MSSNPLSPTPRRWNSPDPGSTSPSAYGTRTQAVMDDVERMISRLSEAAESADRGSSSNTQSEGASFHTPLTRTPEPEVLEPPVRLFLPSRGSDEGVPSSTLATPGAPRAGRLDPTRLSRFLGPPVGSSPLRKSSSQENLRTGRSLFGARNSPLRRTTVFAPETPQVTQSEMVRRPRSTPPREETHAPPPSNVRVEEDDGPTPRSSFASFDSYVSSSSSSGQKGTDPSQSSSPTPKPLLTTQPLPLIRPLKGTRGGRIPPPLPLRRDRNFSGISGVSGVSSDVGVTLSEAGRRLDRSLEALSSISSHDSVQDKEREIGRDQEAQIGSSSSSTLGDLLSSSSDSPPDFQQSHQSVPLAPPLPLLIPLPESPARQRSPAPARSWVRDPYVSRALDGMSAPKARRELLTPVEERTERSRSVFSEDGKPLPLVPPIEGLPRSRSSFQLSTPSSTRTGAATQSSPLSQRSAHDPSTPARATNLITFFEKAASPGELAVKGGHSRGQSEPASQNSLNDSQSGRSYPGSGFVPPLQPTRQPVEVEVPRLPRVMNRLPTPVLRDEGVHRDDMGVLSNLRKGASSPLKSVRNVVAAWRGRVIPLSRAGTMNSQPPGTASNSEYIAGQAEAGADARERGILDDAFVSIRRMSTKRKPNRANPALESITENQTRPLVVRKWEKPLPEIQMTPRSTQFKPAGESRAQLVSTYTEMTSEPLRIGELWYLNVHGGEPYRWIKCDAELFHDRLVLSWIAQDSRGSRGVVTLDLLHCQEVRSIPSPNHPSARDDIGSIAARGDPIDDSLSSNLFPFQLVYEDGLERLGSNSARDRVRWVSAIWDILENGPNESDGPTSVVSHRSVPSENGSQTTHVQAPAYESDPTSFMRDNSRRLMRDDSIGGINRNSRAMDDGLIHDTQGSLIPLTRNLSKRVTGRTGSLLRRIASEADLDIGQNVLSGHTGSFGRTEPRVSSGTPTEDQARITLPLPIYSSQLIATRTEPVSPSTSFTETDIGPSASMVGINAPRIDKVGTESDVFGTAFSQHTLGRRSAQRIPRTQSSVNSQNPKATSYSQTFKTAISSNSGVDSQVTLRPPPLPKRRTLESGPNSYYETASTFDPEQQANETMSIVSFGTVDTQMLDILEQESTIGSFNTPRGSISKSRTQQSYRTAEEPPAIKSRMSSMSTALATHQRNPLQMVSRETRDTSFFTATAGTTKSYVSAKDDISLNWGSLSASSGQHAASILDYSTSVSSSAKTLSTVSSGGTDTSESTIRGSKPPSSKPSSKPKSTISSSTSRTTLSESMSTTNVSSAATTERIHDDVSRSLDNLVSVIKQQEFPRDRNNRMIRSQLERIEGQVADIGSFLAIKPPPVAKSNSETVVNSSSSASSSESSNSEDLESLSSTNTSPPTTPKDPSSDLRHEIIEMKDYMGGILDRSDMIMDEQRKLREIMEDQLLTESDKTKARAPTLHRLEDLLLRLLVNSGDSEILHELGQTRSSTSSRRSEATSYTTESAHSRFTSEELTESSIYSDERGLKAPAPPGSPVSHQHNRGGRDRSSGIPDSLLVTTPRIDGELDEDWEMHNLPAIDAPVADAPRRRAQPPDLSHLRRQQPAPIDVGQSSDEELHYEPLENEDVPTRQAAPVVPRRPAPAPIMQPASEPELPSTPSSDSTITPPRPRQHHSGPAPQPLGVPSPIGSSRPMPMPPSSFRPMPMPSMLPRPSRLAGTREPMTTTYFRRGFPPPMFPPPMVGPHMGPYAGGAPGLPGFGGPFGPNVFPRPGYPPPGAAGGEYGLPRRPMFPNRLPRGDLSPLSRSSATPSYSDYSDESSTSDSSTLEEVKEAVQHLDEVQHQAIDRTQALAEAQGQQSNDIGRYLNQLGEAMDSNEKDRFDELMSLHEDIGKIREQIAQGNNQPQTDINIIGPAEVVAPILPEKTVPVNIVPLPSIVTPAPTSKPAKASVSVNIPMQTPPAAVMTVSEHSEQASPVIHSPAPLAHNKDHEQDLMLKDLQRKVSDLMKRMSQPDIVKVTEHEVQNRPYVSNGDVRVTRITEVETGPGPLPPKSTSQGERIRITEGESGPLQHNTVSKPSVSPLVTPVASSSISDPAAQISGHQPTIIPSGPLTIPSGAPTASVHFAPEHVKETVTEQVIRGPGMTGNIEKETIREYDRTASDVAAGRAPAHETVVEKEIVTGPGPNPTIVERTTEVIHDAHAPLSVHPPSSAGSNRPLGIQGNISPEVIHEDHVEVVRNPSSGRASRVSHRAPKTTVVLEEDAHGHPITTTTIEEHDVGGRYPGAPTVRVQDSISQAPGPTVIHAGKPTTAPTVIELPNLGTTGAPTTIHVQMPSTRLDSDPSGTVHMGDGYQDIDGRHTSVPSPVGHSGHVQPDIVVADTPTGLLVRPTPTATSSSSGAKTGNVRDRPISQANVPVQPTTAPTVHDPIGLPVNHTSGTSSLANIPNDGHRPASHDHGSIHKRPTSTGNVPTSVEDSAPIVSKKPPPPPRPIMVEGDAPGGDSTPVRPSIHTPAEIAAVDNDKRPGGLLRKKPSSIKQKPVVIEEVSDPNTTGGAVAQEQPRVHFVPDRNETTRIQPGTDSTTVPPITKSANIPATPAPIVVPPRNVTSEAPLAPTQLETPFPTHGTASTNPSNVPNGTSTVPVSGPTKHATLSKPPPSVVHQQPVISEDPSNVRPTSLPATSRPTSLANVPNGTSPEDSSHPIREQPVTRPATVAPSPAPIVTDPSGEQRTGVIPSNQSLAPLSSHTVLSHNEPVAHDLANKPVRQEESRPNVLKKRPSPSPKNVNTQPQPDNIVSQQDVPDSETRPTHSTVLADGQSTPPVIRVGRPGAETHVVKPARPLKTSEVVTTGHPNTFNGDPSTFAVPPGSTGVSDPATGKITSPAPIVIPGPGSASGQPIVGSKPGTMADQNISVPRPGTSTVLNPSADPSLEKERIAAQAKANAEKAEQERLSREKLQKENEALARLAADRHKEQQDALSELKKTLQDHGSNDTKWKSTYADDAKAKEKRRTDRDVRDKKWQDALDKLIVEKESDKKWREAEGKKPGTQAVIEYLKKNNDDMTGFLRSLANDIIAQNSNQHQLTQQAAKAWAREQVGFNLSGYLDDFSKALSSEVRALLKEVGDLRETRRALYYELAELLLLKGRQSHGDLMAVLPFPTAGGVGAGPGIGLPKPTPNKPNPPAPAAKPAPTPAPAAPPAWQSYNLPPNMNIGGPSGGPSGQNANKPKPPSGGSRPLPVPGDVVMTTTTTTHQA